MEYYSNNYHNTKPQRRTHPSLPQLGSQIVRSTEYGVRRRKNGGVDGRGGELPRRGAPLVTRAVGAFGAARTVQSLSQVGVNKDPPCHPRANVLSSSKCGRRQDRRRQSSSPSDTAYSFPQTFSPQNLSLMCASFFVCLPVALSLSGCHSSLSHCRIRSRPHEPS